MADILSQEEIDALLSVVEDDSIENDRKIYNNNNLSERQITLYDFKRPNRIYKEQLRALRGIHDKFARILATDLSLLLKSIVEVQLHSVDQMTYGEFLMSLPNPTKFTIFSAEPLNGLCVLEVDPSILFPIVDRLLGGRGEPFDDSRELSTLELKLLENFDKIVTKNLNKSWKDISPINVKINSNELSPNIVQITAQNEIVVVCVYEINIGHSSGMMNFCYPVQTLEPILNKLSNLDKQLSSKSNNLKNSKSNNLNDLLNFTKFKCDHIVGTRKMTLNEINNINIGDTLLFNEISILKINNESKIILNNNKNDFKGNFKNKFKITEFIDNDRFYYKEYE